MAQIAKISAIFLILAFVIPGCSPANEIQTEVDNAQQNAKFESKSALTTPVPQNSPEVITPTKEEAQSASFDSKNAEAEIAGNSDLISLQAGLLQLYALANPGVVSVRSDELDGFSVSSGFFVDDMGHVVTSYHGVKTESDLTVTTSSGEILPARMVAKDPDSDIAVLKVETSEGKITPLLLGVSDDLQVGQIVAAIGNPFGLEGSMTTGVVSGTGQGLRYFREALGENAQFPGEIILTDTAMNPGNSGGPLLNLNGEVIGINSTVITTGGDRNLTGVAFSLPIDLAKPIINALVEEGVFEYPHLGFSSIDELSYREREALGFPEENGIYITEIEPGGPADRAGLIAGTEESGITTLSIGSDLITAVDGHEVNRYDQLYVYLIKHKRPGENIILTVLREDQQQEFILQLDSRPEPENQDW